MSHPISKRGFDPTRKPISLQTSLRYIRRYGGINKACQPSKTWGDHDYILYDIYGLPMCYVDMQRSDYEC